jgi:hypothetical protein
MPTPTYTLIDSVTLTSSASSVTFSSIPAGGDLVLISTITATGNDNIEVEFNGDTTDANYNYVSAYTYSGSAYSGSSSNRLFLNANSNAISANPLLSVFQVMDYSANDKQKTTLNRANLGNEVRMDAGRWEDTSAITSITLKTILGNSMASGSTLFLYGIAKEL